MYELASVKMAGVSGLVNVICLGRVYNDAIACTCVDVVNLCTDKSYSRQVTRHTSDIIILVS